MANQTRREFALLKVRNCPTELFWIIRLDLERLSLGASETAMDADAARNDLAAAGCSDDEIAQLLRDARRTS